MLLPLGLPGHGGSGRTLLSHTPGRGCGDEESTVNPQLRWSRGRAWWLSQTPGYPETTYGAFWGLQRTSALGVFEVRPWLSQGRICPEPGDAEPTAPAASQGLGLSLVSQWDAWKSENAGPDALRDASKGGQGHKAKTEGQAWEEAKRQVFASSRLRAVSKEIRSFITWFVLAGFRDKDPRAPLEHDNRPRYALSFPGAKPCRAGGRAGPTAGARLDLGTLHPRVRLFTHTSCP